MKFSWEALLATAQKCVQIAAGEPDAALREAWQRCAVSRAYYAAFGSALVWIRRNSPTHPIPNGGEAHQAVQDFFEWNGDPNY